MCAMPVLTLASARHSVTGLRPSRDGRKLGSLGRKLFERPWPSLLSLAHPDTLEACKWKDEQLLATHHVILGSSDVI